MKQYTEPGNWEFFSPVLMTAWAALARILPWLLALGYLGFIASLGQAFHTIAPWQVNQMLELSAQASSDLEAPPYKPVKLGFVRLVKAPPQTRSLVLDFPSQDKAMAVLFPRMTSNAHVYLNDQLIASPPSTYRSSFQYQPQLVALPDQLLQPANNRLRVDLHSQSPVMMLAVFYLGPVAALEPTFLAFDFFRQTLISGALAVSALLALFMATIWWARKNFTEYGWLALAFAGFSYYLNSFVGTSQPPFDSLYDWSFLLARAACIWAFVCFVHRFLGYRRPVLEWGLAAFFALVFGVGLVMVLNDHYTSFLRLTYLTSLPMVLASIAYLNVILAIALGRSGHVYLHWLQVGALMGLLLGIHDVLVLMDFQHWLVRDFYISHYAIIFITVGYGGVLVSRVAHALLSSEDLNLKLNQLLAKRTQELEQASEAKMATERRLALYSERQRLLADMHDGIGGQLVSLIAAQQAGGLSRRQISAQLEAMLADLRLLLDALSPAGEDGLLALARLIERYRPLLAAAGISLQWQPHPQAPDWPLSPSHTIQLLRLTQEAIQNIVKHAKATQIVVRLAHSDRAWRLDIADDGQGIAADSQKGYGSQTLLSRARAMNGQLQVKAGDAGGVQVTLQVPDPS